MKWFVVLSLVAEVLATSVTPVGFGSLHARRSKRTLGRRVGGICKPRPSEFPASTSVVSSTSTTSSRPQTTTSTTTTTTRSASPSLVPVQGLTAKVLPLGLGNSVNSWTTVPNTTGDYHALADTGSTLRPTRVLGGSLAAVGTAPDGRAAMEVFFGKGSYAFASGVAGGISFYAYGPSDLSSGNEFTLGYSIFFESGFDFVRGGKLPGLYGGTSNDEAASCSGGRHAATCFSTRFMWRDQGAAELYAYLPSDPDNKCESRPG
ncbi:unnamed protein product [Rhizoctonia solani]|uniref:Polysaccharide lyase 14 domain-containing protein n=1 Tax=Rhizoctonia solani TaxID=456999 RepID=A0A8H3GKG8_9AGAM|nr:unnamed protein product [Rhizoctonia solani]